MGTMPIVATNVARRVPLTQGAPIAVQGGRSTPLRVPETHRRRETASFRDEDANRARSPAESVAPDGATQGDATKVRSNGPR